MHRPPHDPASDPSPEATHDAAHDPAPESVPASASGTFPEAAAPRPPDPAGEAAPKAPSLSADTAARETASASAPPEPAASTTPAPPATPAGVAGPSASVTSAAPAEPPAPVAPAARGTGSGPASSPTAPTPAAPATPSVSGGPPRPWARTAGLGAAAARQYVLALFRAVTGLLFACHGAASLFGVLGGAHGTGGTVPAGAWPGWYAAVIQLVGGVLVLLGLGTRAAALVCSGSMAYAYFTVHQARDLWPLQNGGEPAALFCWSFLLLAVTGPGALSLDALLGRSGPSARRGRRDPLSPPSSTRTEP